VIVFPTEAKAEVHQLVGEIDNVAHGIMKSKEQQTAATQEIVNAAHAMQASQAVTTRIESVSQQTAQVGARAGEVSSAVAGVTDRIGRIRQLLVSVVRTTVSDTDDDKAA
jgi:methyl-accepting chemotaxis protein